jgi:membrane fusion protein, adhesin transport system
MSDATSFPKRYASTMALVRPSRLSRVLAGILLAIFFLSLVLLSLTPWQQSAAGSGRVVAYEPEERQQDIGAPVDGRIQRWLVREGSTVKKGDPIVDLTDIDPEILMRLRRERDAILDRLETAKARAISLRARIESLERARDSGLVAADSRVRMAKERVIAAGQALALADATLATAKLNVERQKTLTEQGLTSRRQLELTELEELRARTELERAKAALAAARSEEAALESDRAKIGSDAMAAVSDARASQAAAEVEVANASAELERIEVRLARQSAQWVRAPRDGTIFRIVANGHEGEIVKAGDVLAILVPEAKERAVELWIPGNDMPLIREGAVARVQFEG